MVDIDILGKTIPAIIQAFTMIFYGIGIFILGPWYGYCSADPVEVAEPSALCDWNNPNSIVNIFAYRYGKYPAVLITFRDDCLLLFYPD